jgi:trigger factor
LDVTINTLSTVRQEAEISVSTVELQPHFDKAYQKYLPKVEVKGFRKGKVPMEMVKRLYGEAIEYEALDDVATEVYRQAMTERNIAPLGTPTMVDMDFKRGDHFKFKIQYDVRPAVELGTYKGLRLEKFVHAVTEEEIETEVHHLRRTNATTTEVPSVTDEEHIVTADAQELDETGSPIVGKKTVDARFYLADPSLVPAIKSALSSATVGQTYRAAFESSHGDHTHNVSLDITPKKIEKLTLPPFDDELVKKISGGKTATPAEFRTQMRDDLARYWSEQSERRLDDAIAQELVKAHDFLVPDSMMNSFLDAFVDDIKNKSRDRKLPKNFDEKKFREENKEYALWQSKWLLVKERIADVEKLTVTDAELEALAASEAVKIGVDKERLLEYYRASSAGNERLMTDKIMTFLKEHATITEKPMETPQG